MTTLNATKSSNFDLILRNDLTNVVFHCQAANLPGLSIGQINIPYMGQQNEIPGDSLNWNPLLVSVLCDENLDAFSEAYKIITMAKALDGTYNCILPVFDATLIITSNKNNTKRIATFKSAWVQDVSDLNFETTGDDSFLTFAITIKYLQYELGDVVQNN